MKELIKTYIRNVKSISFKEIKRLVADQFAKTNENNCIWIVDGAEHGGEIKAIEMFDGQICVTCCDKHLDAHKKIMALCAHGIEMHAVLKMKPEKIDEEIKEKHIWWKYTRT